MAAMTPQEHEANAQAQKANVDAMVEAANIAAYIGKTDIRDAVAQLVEVAEIGWFIKAIQENEQNHPQSEPEPTPTPAPISTPPKAAKVKGVWISPDEVKALGPVPQNVRDAARGPVSAQLDNNNSNNDAYCYANALIAVHDGDQGAEDKAIAGINSLPRSPFARVLEMSRNLPMYVFAADLLDYHDHDGFFRSMVTKPLQGHSGAKNMLETAQYSGTNWGGMSTAACTAIGLHIGDDALVDEMVRVTTEWCEGGPGKLRYSDTNWHADPAHKRGVNAPNATLWGHPAWGVLPEDFRRGGEFTWPPKITGYMLEGLTPRIVTLNMLVRAGKIRADVGQDAHARAVRYLYEHVHYPIQGDDRTIIYVINRLLGLGLKTDGDSIAKDVAFAGYTHG